MSAASEFTIDAPENTVTPEQFRDLIAPITASIGNRPLEATLDANLDAKYPAGGPAFTAVFDVCRKAIEAGWMCNHEAGRCDRIHEVNVRRSSLA